MLRSSTRTAQISHRSSVWLQVHFSHKLASIFLHNPLHTLITRNQSDNTMKKPGMKSGVGKTQNSVNSQLSGLKLKNVRISGYHSKSNSTSPLNSLFLPSSLPHFPFPRRRRRPNVSKSFAHLFSNGGGGGGGGPGRQAESRQT